MGSTRGLLHEEEELLAEVRPHPVVVAGPVLLFVVALAGAIAIAVHYPDAPIVVAWLLAGMVLLPALWATARVLRWRSVRFLVTTSRLLYRRGVFGRDVVQLRLQRVAEVQCSQSFGGRLIGAGRLVFEVAGGDGPLVVEDLRWPRRLQRVITVQLDRLDVRPRALAGYDAYGAYGTYGGEVAYGGDVAYGGVPAPDPTLPVRRGGWDTAGVGSRRRRRARGSRSLTDTPPHGVVLEDDDGDSRSIPGQILQLDELRRRGILSEAEFAAKKAELLGRL